VSHYSEDDLILYFYGEGGRRRPRIERHLGECAACAAAYREIAGTLQLVGEPESPERGEQYGLEVWQRIRHQLPERDASWLAAWFGHRLALGAAAAALVVAAFLAGRVWPTPPGPSAVTATPAVADGGSRNRVLLTSVAEHLDRSGRVLADLVNATDGGDISAEQRWADDLLTTSRLYRQEAVEAGEQSVASVLDELERTLVEIVHSPSPISAAELEQLRRRVDAAALLFKVRVMSDEINRRETAPVKHGQTT